MEETHNFEEEYRNMTSDLDKIQTELFTGKNLSAESCFIYLEIMDFLKEKLACLKVIYMLNEATTTTEKDIKRNNLISHFRLYLIFLILSSLTFCFGIAFSSLLVTILSIMFTTAAIGFAMPTLKKGLDLLKQYEQEEETNDEDLQLINELSRRIDNYEQVLHTKLAKFTSKEEDFDIIINANTAINDYIFDQRPIPEHLIPTVIWILQDDLKNPSDNLEELLKLLQQKIEEEKDLILNLWR